ncbi:hypothetical protein [Sinobacterium norvegicum]|nr:hypothetical protein [Sinobacterium norvegicum]
MVSIIIIADTMEVFANVKKLPAPDGGISFSYDRWLFACGYQ